MECHGIRTTVWTNPILLDEFPINCSTVESTLHDPYTYEGEALDDTQTLDVCRSELVWRVWGFTAHLPFKWSVWGYAMCARGMCGDVIKYHRSVMTCRLLQAARLSIDHSNVRKYSIRDVDHGASVWTRGPSASHPHCDTAGSSAHIPKCELSGTGIVIPRDPVVPPQVRYDPPNTF